MKETLDDIKEDKNWFCPLPFNHIYSNSDGTWMPCCLSKPTKVLDESIISTDKKVIGLAKNSFGIHENPVSGTTESFDVSISDSDLSVKSVKI